MKVILSLSDKNATLENVGGKGMSLAKLINCGLPVPGGFHVTTEAYRLYVADNGIREYITKALRDADPSDPAALERKSEEIRNCFLGGQTPAAIASEVAIAYGMMNNAPVAVRSSATAEDLPDASFAGQQDTYLNIAGTSRVLEAIKKCWASLWTSRAIAYRIRNGIDQDGVALAVVVQMLVFSDAAGIMFTANPSNGSRGELVINAAWGLGEAVVSGMVTPDAVIVDKERLRVSRRDISDKTVMTVRNDKGTGEVPVPDPIRKKPALNPEQTMELARLGIRIEELYGTPMDIEWALEKGRLYIVQARPITVLPPEWKTPDPKGMYNRTSLAEHIPGPVTPLFATLGLETANRESYRFWEEIMGKTARKVCPDKSIYKAINGYVYLGIHMSLANSLKMIGMSLKQSGSMLRGSVERWRSARNEFEALVEKWENKPCGTLGPRKLLEGAKSLFEGSCRYFTAIQTTLPAASVSELLFTKFYNLLIKRKQDPPAAEFLLGSETNALKAEKSIYDMVGWIKTVPDMKDYWLDTPVEVLRSEMKRDNPPQGISPESWNRFRLRFESHLNDYGKTAYEFDFANPVPAESPELLMETIKACLEEKSGDPYARQKEALGKREAAEEKILQRIGWPRKKWFERLLRWARGTGPMREDSIFDMGMGHPLIRTMLNELGMRFAANGAINESRDIYWLEKNEVEALTEALEKGIELPGMANRIPERKKQLQWALKAVPPVILPEKSRLNRLLPGSGNEKKNGRITLKGAGTSGGTVTAPACILHGPDDFVNFRKGDILVAVTTTPAWTPLFSLASAVVTDIGGPLSHSSIVAREYGIPAVMATRIATRSIRSGQVITVNGTAGTVTIEPAS